MWNNEDFPDIFAVKARQTVISYIPTHQLLMVPVPRL